MQPSTELIEDAIKSILGFIRRTAEAAPSGHVWETIDYQNQPHRDVSVFNGVGGISFFLVDAFRRYQDPAMLDLAQGAIDWCAAFNGSHYERGLQFGKTGPALAALHKSIALAEPIVPEFCLSNAAVILRESPGPITDLVGGAASNGLFLLKLWARTRDDIYLRGAERCAAWLDLQMRRDKRGTHCIVDPEGRLGFGPQIYLGVAHGLAGIAHFLACLAEATGNERWATLARELFDTVARYALPAHGGLNWSVHLESKELNRCQWSHGAAGIGLTFLTAHRVLGDSRFLDLALQAAEATWSYGDFRHNYTQCTGLAGSGELLLETYRVTGDARWLDRAIAFAHLALVYQESTPEGDAWPTDTPGLHSADFSYGAAGVGHFFLRVLSGGTLPMPLM
jgi:lantibiotic modifying enzyme